LVASSVAFAVVVQTVQGESMSESTSQAGPFTGVEGVSIMRWNSGATTNAVASAQVNPSASVEQLVVRARQGASGGGTLAVLLDGQVVGTFSPSTSGFAPHTITLANPLSAGSHTLAIRPNATLPVRADVDYVELHDTGGTPLPPAACADGQDNDLDGSVDYPRDEGCSSSTDNDETNAPSPTGEVFVGAGDIADVGDADVATGNIIDGLPNATAWTAGDNAYENGSASDFSDKYEPSWGGFKGRTWPTPGNHDYKTSGASGYKGYFDDGSLERATPIGTQTYHAQDIGGWRWYFLDSNIGATKRSAQYRWLQQDLNANVSPGECVGAIWHHPVISTGAHGSLTKMRAIFVLLDQAAYDADLVLEGHDHNYERFAKHSSTGEASESGIQSVVVGTGGTALRPFMTPEPGLPTTVERDATTHGVLMGELTPTGGSFKFLQADYSTNGSFTDQFLVSCN
jgi:acid phosphatase type 7